MSIELTDTEKTQILEQRLKQFAAEKFNHEVNKQILVAQQEIVDEASTEQLLAEVVKTEEAIAIIDNAIVTTSNMINDLSSGE